MKEGSGNQLKLKSDSRGLSRLSLRLSASANFKTSSYNEVISYKEKKKTSTSAINAFLLGAVFLPYKNDSS